jgi:hypothetical protein
MKKLFDLFKNVYAKTVKIKILLHITFKFNRNYRMKNNFLMFLILNLWNKLVSGAFYFNSMV